MGYFMVSYSDDDLMHHGIKGQKWGVRRFQDKHGALTAEGRARYKQSKAETKQALKTFNRQYRINTVLNSIPAATNKGKKKQELRAIDQNMKAIDYLNKRGETRQLKNEYKQLKKNERTQNRMKKQYVKQTDKYIRDANKVGKTFTKSGNKLNKEADKILKQIDGKPTREQTEKLVSLQRSMDLSRNGLGSSIAGGKVWSERNKQLRNLKVGDLDNKAFKKKLDSIYKGDEDSDKTRAYAQVKDYYDAKLPSPVKRSTRK